MTQGPQQPAPLRFNNEEKLRRQMRKRGWDVQGTELSEKSAAYARDVLGIPMSTGDLTDLHFRGDHFDAVVMWPDQPRQSYRYRRLVLPFKRRDGSSVLLGTTLHDPDIDLRIKRNQELLQVLQ